MTEDAHNAEEAQLDVAVAALRARFDGHPVRPLDYVVFGVPRSGTTAVARYLNAHRDVICLHERFTPQMMHKGFTFPDALFDANWGGEVSRRMSGKRNLLRFVADKTGPIALWGSKTPRYYLRLPRMMAGIPSGKALFCYRHPEEVAQSFNDRALDPNDHWLQQLRGLFGIIELPICLARMLATPGDYLTVPHRATRDDAAGTAAAILGFLSPGTVHEADASAFAEADEIGASRLARRRLPLRQVEENACAMIASDRINAILSTDLPRPLSEVEAEVKDWLLSLPADLVQRGINMAEAYGPNVVAFAQDIWAPEVRPAWLEARRALGL